MNIILITHPPFLESQSMPLFANMLYNGLTSRGHNVRIVTAQARFSKKGASPLIKKWLGYADQFLLFPKELKSILKQQPENTIVVFTDQALGPWIPHAISYPHVVHCHDFLAQRSSNGEFAENKLGLSGKAYQSFIKRGYQKARNFISISKNTQQDLHHFLNRKPMISEVVYNGLNRDFFPVTNTEKLRSDLSKTLNIQLTKGFIFHIGGNTFYKNRIGVLEIYEYWRKTNEESLPLVMVGPPPDAMMSEIIAKSKYKTDIHTLSGTSNDMVRNLYQAATMLLFPSLEEGFGWPIAEAQASGCPVITTDKTPMTEVGGNAAFYIKRRNGDFDTGFLTDGAKAIHTIASYSEEQRLDLRHRGLVNAKRFNQDLAMNKIEEVYTKVLEHKNTTI